MLTAFRIVSRLNTLTTNYLLQLDECYLRLPACPPVFFV